MPNGPKSFQVIGFDLTIQRTLPDAQHLGRSAAVALVLLSAASMVARSTSAIVIPGPVEHRLVAVAVTSDITSATWAWSASSITWTRCG